MITIKFTARPVREKPEHSTEDANVYEVKYIPARGGIHGTVGGDFSNLLLEAICDLPEHNPSKEAVRVEMEGEFPEKYVQETERLTDLYSRAEKVNVRVYRETAISPFMGAGIFRGSQRDVRMIMEGGLTTKRLK